MTETARLVLAVDSREVDRGQRSLDGLTNKSRRAEQETERLTRATDQLSGAYNGLRKVLAAVGAGLAVRAVIRAADTYSELESQLRLVTDSQEELNDTFDAAYKLAQDTRGSLEGTIQLYSRLARSTDGLGLSSEDLLTITQAINQSFVVSGASAEEAAGAIRQLAQGIASGTLRGDELNSVLENSPRLARAISEGLGVTIGELRALGAEGKITGEAITGALLQTADSIDREFQDMPRTVGQSLQQLRNDLIHTFGQTDVSGFNDAIDDLRGLVTDPGFQEGVVSLGTGIATLARWLGTATTEGVKFTKWLGEEFAAAVNGVANDDLVRLEQQADKIRAMLDGDLLANIDSRINFIGPGGFLEYYNDSELEAALAQIERKIAEARQNQGPLLLNRNSGNDDDTGDPPEPLGGGGDDKATKAIQKRVAALQLEAETLGMTARQEELYTARKEGATAAQLAAIDGSYRQIEAYEAEQKALEFSIKSRRDAAEILAEMDKERATDIDAGEQLLERYMTEEELLQEHHERRLDVLEAARAADFDNKEKWDRAIEAENQRHEDAVSDVSKKEQFARNQLASNMLSQMSSLMSSKYKEFFLIGKAAALANVAVMAPEKAEAAAAWGMKLGGPPLAAAFTAASYIVSAAHAAQIASANFGGGGGVSGSGGYGGGVNSVPAAPAPVQLNPGAESGGSSGSLTIVFQGDVTGFDQDELADTLMNKMGDEINNLDRVVIDPKSRNGRLLRGR